MKRFLRALATCLTFTVLGNAVQAQIDEPQTIMAPDQPNGNAYLDDYEQLFVCDDKVVPVIGTCTYVSGANVQTELGVKNKVYLKYNWQDNEYETVPYDLTVYFDITPYDFNGTGSVISKSLTIRFDTVQRKVLDYLDVFEFTGAYKVKVNVTDIVKVTSLGTTYPATAPRNVELGAVVWVDRKYQFNPSGTVANILPPTISAQPSGLTTTMPAKVELSWQPYDGAEEYDLEYTFVDKYHADYNTTLSDAHFAHNATRVMLSAAQTAYAFDYLFPEGVVLYRVRAVHYDIDGTRRTTDWNYTPSTATSSCPSCVYIDPGTYDLTAHEPGLHWYAQRVFAEGGKQSPAVSYYDGLLRTRLKGNLSYATERASFQQTIYDANGRPALNTLAAPDAQRHLSFKPSWSKTMSGTPFGYADMDVASCLPQPESMDSTSGASRYFSHNNPFLLANSDYRFKESHVPSAQGYPYTLTQFTADNTGRVRCQGGVGLTLKLGNRDTKYMYGQPMQEDLDRLFGTEAGYKSHYFKNVVVDPNGQASVTYIDAHGRTVATALAGQTPDNLNALASNDGDVNVTNNLIKEPEQTLIDNKIISTTGYTNVATADHHFVYNLSPSSLLPPCTEDVCYECKYDLIITITSSNCAFNNGAPYIESLKNYQFTNPETALPTACTTAVDMALTFDLLDMPAGEYVIEKVLSVNEQAADNYAQQYLQQADCLIPYSQFLSDALDALDFSSCDMSCAECTTALGTESAFVSNYLSELIASTPGYVTTADDETAAHEIYNGMAAECEELCQHELDCDLYYQQMLHDVSPDGQYMRVDESSPGQHPMYLLMPDGYSVGSVVCQYGDPRMPQHHNFMHPTTPYVDDAGNPAQVYNSAGQLVAPEQLTWQEFRDNFDESWAKSLIEYHPEYPYYEWCLAHAESEAFLTEMMNQATFDEAYDNGFLDPLAISTDYPNPLSTFSTTNKDPLFSYYLSTDVPSSYAAQIQNKFEHFFVNTTMGVDLSLWEFVYATVYCDGDMTCAIAGTLADPQCPGDENLAWHMFKVLYRQIRNDVHDDARHVYISGLHKNNDNIGTYNDAGSSQQISSQSEGYDFTNNWPNNYWQIPVFWGKNYFNKTVYEQNTKRFPREEDIAGMVATGAPGYDTQMDDIYEAQQNVATICQSNCELQADGWMQKLDGCSMTSQQHDQIKAALIAVCVAGCDIDHPMGSRDAPGGAQVAGDPNVYLSFEDVLIKVLGVSPTDIECNALSIPFPGTYENPIAMTNPLILSPPDECVCNRLTELKSEYDAAVTAATFTGTFAEYMTEFYSSVLTQADLDELLGVCQPGNPCDYLTHPMTLPQAMACGQCVGCEQLANGLTEFNYWFYPNGQTHPLYWEKLATFLNLKFGFNLSYVQYAETIAECTGNTGTADDLITEGFPVTTECEDGDLYCSQIIAAVEAFDLVPTNPNPGQAGYNAAIAAALNAEFGFNLTYTDYYDFLQNCYPETYITQHTGWIEPGNETLDCATLIALITSFNGCTDGAPNVEGYPCMLTDYLNQITGLGFPDPAGSVIPYTFANYQQMVIDCIGETAAAELIGTKKECIDDIDCRSLYSQLLLQRERIQRLLDANTDPTTGVVDVAGFFADLALLMNDLTGAEHDICWYYDLLLQCPEVKISDLQELFLNHLPVCGELDCANLLQNIQNFNNQDPNYPDNTQAYMDGVTEYLNDIYSNHFYLYCDYFLTLQDCYGTTVAEQNLGNGGKCDLETPTCYWLKNKILNFNTIHNITNPDDYPDYDHEITAYLNQVFQDTRDYCDYFYMLSDCYGINYAYTHLGHYQDCTIKLDCHQLIMQFKEYTETLSGPFSSTFDGPGLSNYLNGYFNQQLYYCDYYLLFLNCFGQEACMGMGIDDKPCNEEPLVDCGLCEDLIFKVTAFNLQTFGSEQTGGSAPVPGYQLLLADFLNDQFDISMPYAWWFNLLEHCYGDEEKAKGTIGVSDDDFAETLPCVIQIDYESSPAWTAMSGNTTAELCNIAVFPVIPGDPGNDCLDQLQALAEYNAQYAYQQYTWDIIQQIRQQYIDHCLQAADVFTMEHPQNEYHYTLYYYDQAGNLVKTVPPNGVNPIKATDVYTPTNTPALEYVKNYRKFVGQHYVWSSGSNVGTYKDPYVPTHTYQSKYRFNTLNQPVQQNMPDQVGSSSFWYDVLGRLVVSRDPQQAVVIQGAQRFSYTLYDEQGRIKEVGEVSQSLPMSNVISRDPVSLAGWLANAASREQVTYTKYDAAMLSPADQTAAFGAAQTNLRSRVAAVMYEDVWDNDPNTYTRATHYSYDVAGNVHTMVQELDGLAAYSQRFKRVAYDYDLVSGKVNKVIYQPGEPDQFIHRYDYDADNRLEEVYTSADGEQWTREADYEYYLYGPLSRTTLGQYEVQGLDYFYTAQGWLKGVNGTEFGPTRDAGRDGYHTFVYPNNGYPLYLNTYTARDVFGYTLNYFEGDYAPAGLGAAYQYTNPERGHVGTGFGNGAPSLYNGNIRSSTVSLSKVNGTAPIGYAYGYDQLNRLTGMDAYAYDLTNHQWAAAGTALDDYKERAWYDPNGNILRYERNGTTQGNLPLQMDEFSYRYQLGANNGAHDVAAFDKTDPDTYMANLPGSNRLSFVQDAIGDANYGTDIDDQNAYNYHYDRSGRLIQDDQEQLAIEWTAYGKVKKVTNNATNPPATIEFAYDAMGQRVSKTVTDPQANVTTTVYVRDAQGNVMSTYEVKDNAVAWDEAYIYGSGRIGSIRKPDSLFQRHNPSVNPPGEDSKYHFLGLRRYELSNHLGNVLAVITDKTIPKDFYDWNSMGSGSDGTVDNFLAVVVEQGDYYPFGAPMPMRSYSWYGGGNWLVLNRMLSSGETVTAVINGSTITLCSYNSAYTTVADYYNDIITNLPTGLTATVDGDKLKLSGWNNDDVLTSEDALVAIETNSDYRFGFNGKEKDNEWKGFGSSYDFGARMYDPRLGKFLSLDPWSDKYPWQTPYAYHRNSPIWTIDWNGFGDPPKSPNMADRHIFSNLNFFKGSETNSYLLDNISKESLQSLYDEALTKGVKDGNVSLSNGQTWYVNQNSGKFYPVRGNGIISLTQQEVSFLRTATDQIKSGKGITTEQALSNMTKAMEGQGYKVSPAFESALTKFGQLKGVSNEFIIAKFGRPTQVASDLQSAARSRFSGTPSYVKWGGRTLIALAVAADVYEIYTSENRMKTVTKKVYGWSFAAAGSWAAGTLIAGQAGPQAATPEEIITVPAAYLIGGVTGYLIGEEVVEQANEWVFDRIK